MSDTLPHGWPQPPESLVDTLITPADFRYASVRSSYMAVGSPAVVLMARNEDDVVAGITYAAQVREASGTMVPVSLRSGGHGIAGTSTNQGGLILDVSRLNRVRVLDPTAGLVQAEAGAIWGDVAAALSPHDLALTSGNFGDTGVGGLATAGGLGYFARSQGLTIDRIERVRVLTADGSARWVDPTQEPDLFWALRGGASQVGVALDFIFRAEPMRTRAGNASVVFQEVTYLVDDLPGFTRLWGEWIRTAPRELESFLMVHPAGGRLHGVRAMNMWAGDASGQDSMKAALGLARITHDQTVTTPYAQVVPTPRSRHVGQQQITMRNVLVDHADEQAGEALAGALADPHTALGELRALGGAVADVPADATAWAGRTQEALVATWIHPTDLDSQDTSFAPIQAIGNGTYGAYGSDTRPEAAERAWPGETGRRLRAIAERVDPQGLFNQGLALQRAFPPS